jgi:hypothetical protein
VKITAEDTGELVKIIKAYRSRHTDGYTDTPVGLYATFDEACAKSDYQRDPFEYDTVDMGDGTVWLLDGEPMRFTNDIRGLRESALAKLSPEEKQALGL